jgi:hypothetical protein
MLAAEMVLLQLLLPLMFCGGTIPVSLTVKNLPSQTHYSKLRVKSASTILFLGVSVELLNTK